MNSTPRYTIEIACCEMVILNEIAQGLNRRQIAQTYRLALQSSESETMDWGKVNRAIIERWSVAGLAWIKKQAWSGKCFATGKGADHE